MWKLIPIGLLLVLLTSCEQEDTAVAFQWTTHETIPEVARACAASFVIDDKAYILLGRRGNVVINCWDEETNFPGNPTDSKPGDNIGHGTMLKDVYCFDPIDESWTRKGDFPGTQRVFPIAAVVGQYAYVGLGFSHGCVYQDTAYLQDFWRYNPQDDSWLRLADFPTKSVNAAVSWVFDEEIFVAFGFGVHNVNRDVWKYNPEQNSWVRLADSTPYGRSCAVASADENRIFAGTGFSLRNKADWWEYIPVSDEWIQRRSMPDKGRINAVGFAVNERYFVGAGRHYAGMLTIGHLKDDLLEYAADENRWHRRGVIPGGVRENAASFVFNGRVYVGLGENETITLGDLYSFNPNQP